MTARETHSAPHDDRIYPWRPTPNCYCTKCQQARQIFRLQGEIDKLRAAPVTDGETPRCVVCRTEYPTTGQQAGPAFMVWGEGWAVCKRCVNAGRDAKHKANAP
jgi:hypothetical protein